MIARYRQQLEPLDPNAFYPAKYLARRWAVHEITPWKWVALGVLPPPVKLGPNTSRWSGAVIEAHEERQRGETLKRAQACAAYERGDDRRRS